MTNDQRPTTNDLRPTIVGLTGGIGSGKSTIAHELARRGYQVYDCDREAKRIIAEDAKVQAAIIDLLGEESFVDGKYNTAYVSSKVFSPSPLGEGRGEASSLLAALNSIVHPAVKEDILQRSGLTMSKANGLTAQRSYSAAVFFIESAILYESGFDSLCEKVVYVDAPVEVRVARTVARDHTDAAQVLARIQAQQSLPHKNAVVLSNDGTLSISELVDTLLRPTRP